MLIAPLLISLFGILAPVQVAYAQSAVLSVSPGSSVADVGSNFDVSLLATDIQNLVVYDVTLTFDETLLEYMASNVPAPWVPLGPGVDVLPGRVRVVAGIFSGSVSGPASLVTHTFRMDLSGRSLLHIADSTLGVAGQGAFPHSAVDGTVKSSQTTRSAIKIFNAHAARDSIRLGMGESCMDLVTKVANDGSSDATVMVAYTVVGPAAVFGFVSSPALVAAGGRTEMVSPFCPPELNPGDTYLASAALLVTGLGLVETRHYNHPFSVSA